MSVEPSHLFRYLDGQCLRFNKRSFTDAESWERTVTVADKPIGFSAFLKLKVTTEPVSGKRLPLSNSGPSYSALRGAKLTKVYGVENLVLTRDAGTLKFRSGSFSFLMDQAEMKEVK